MNGDAPSRTTAVACALACLALVGWNGVATSQTPPPAKIRLSDATAFSKIAFRHATGGSGRQYIVEFTLGGLATFDYDGDRLIDIYFTCGSPLAGTPGSARSGALYRNNGDNTFSDVTAQAGLMLAGHGMGACAADYDNDGDQDLMVTNFGSDTLFHNNGDGTFSDVTAAAGVAGEGAVGAGAVFLDSDRDGDLDLYSANYLQFSYERHERLAPTSYPFPPGPQDHPAVADQVFRNNGDGTFADISMDCGVGRLAGPGMGVVAGDFDDDGDMDVFVCNDARPNYLFVNDGKGHFTEEAVQAGVAVDGLGNPNGSMGVDCGDFDNDMLLDLFVTNYTGELSVLYRNLGGGTFEDATRKAQAGIATFPHVKWGTALVDLDNDGDRDLFLANGHFLKDIRKTDQRTDYRVANALLQNAGNGRFLDISRQAGSGLAPVESSRGAAFDDLDNDGDLDGVVLNVNALPTVLRNDTAGAGHWLQIWLRGTASNRDAVGARVDVWAGGKRQRAEVHSGRSYQSHFGTRLHFGLGASARAQRIVIRWLSGLVESHSDVAADRLHVLTEGTGTPSSPSEP